MSTPTNTIEQVCKECFGTGTKLEPGKGARVCDCIRAKQRNGPLDRARIPQRFRRCSLQGYETRNESQQAALSYAFTLVDDFPAVDKGLLIMGGVGVGKTHLAVAIIRDLIVRKGVKCLFYESGSLLKAIQESYSPISNTSEMRVLAPVYESEVLVLDELGASVSTDWVRDTLYQIINTRYNNNKLTIFTTNYLDEVYVDDEIKNLASQLRKLEAGEYTPNKVSEEKVLRKRLGALQNTHLLEDRIGVRLRSRIYEMCKKVVIEGEDFRRQLDQE